VINILLEIKYMWCYIGLSDPIKLGMRSIHNSMLAIGVKMTRSLTDTDEGYNIETS
jgi:hypothetical protein